MVVSHDLHHVTQAGAVYVDGLFDFPSVPVLFMV